MEHLRCWWPGQGPGGIDIEGLPGEERGENFTALFPLNPVGKGIPGVLETGSKQDAALEDPGQVRSSPGSTWSLSEG